MLKKAGITYIINDKVGGVMSLNMNLIRHRQSDTFTQRAILLNDKKSKDTRFNRDVGANAQFAFEYSSLENIYAVLRRLRRLIPDEPGVLVSNNEAELAMLCIYDVQQTVIQIVHDEYNLRLAKKYSSVVDVFIAHSKLYCEKLKMALPARLNDIFYLPYGIPLASLVRQPSHGPLRLVFIGRMTEAKGIFDLPLIDQLLLDSGENIQWTIIGDGPQKHQLQKQWGNKAHVRYFAPETNQEVLTLCSEGDVFVLPTRFEGFPVSLLEAMSTGLVPVVSDLPSGVPEVVTEQTGFRIGIGDYTEFAKAIMYLNHQRELLERMSHVCHQLIVDKFDIRERSKDYHNLFSKYSELRYYNRQTMRLPTHNRLDQPWLPNWLVRSVREFRISTFVHKSS